MTKKSGPKVQGLIAKIEPELIGVVDAELLTGVSKWSWRAYAYSGKIQSVKIGNRLLIPLIEIRRVITEGTRPRTDGLEAGEPSMGRRHRGSSVISAVGEEHSEVSGAPNEGFGRERFNLSPPGKGD